MNTTSRTEKVAVLGGGSFGTILAQMLAENGAQVNLWCRREDVAEQINTNRHNPDYLSFLRLDEKILATSDLAQAVDGSWLIVLAVPGKTIEQVITQLKPVFTSEQFILSAIKGIASPGFRLMHQLIESFLIQSSCPVDNYAILGGPNIAYEMAQQKLAGSVIASRNRPQATRVAKLLSTPYFILMHNPDIFGVELGGALKNVYAIVAGLSDANRMGDNTKSLLVSRAITEISRFAIELGANPATFVGLAGVGDLIVTCFSPKSRNYQLGYAIASESSLEKALEKVSGVAEGVHTLRELHSKAKELGVDMPLAEGIYEIIFQRQNYLRIFRQLVDSMHEVQPEFYTNRG